MDVAYLKTLLEKLKEGGGAGVDAISVHPYRHGSPESAADDLLVVRALAGAPPIWDSEWGYSSTWYGDNDGHADANRQVQAMYTSREMLSAWLMGFPMRVHYALRDSGTDPANAEHNFGLLDLNLGVKPALMDALTTLVAQVGGTVKGIVTEPHRLVGMYPNTVPDLLAIRLLGRKDVRVVMWRKDAVTATTVRFPQKPESVLDERGAALAWTDLGDGTFSIHVGPTLVFATFHRPAAPPAPLVSSATSATPTLSGVTDAGAKVRIFDDGIEVATVTASESGAWSWTPIPPLITGQHVFTVIAISTNGNASDESSPTTMTTVSAKTSIGTKASTGGDGCGAGIGGGLILLAASLLCAGTMRWRVRAGR